MNEQVILKTIQQLLESGAFDNLQEPGKQTLVIYGLLIALAIALARIFLINGWAKKGIDRFFTLEEKKLQELQYLNTKVLSLQNDVKVEHEKLSDVLHLLQANRASDKIS